MTKTALPRMLLDRRIDVEETFRNLEECVRLSGIAVAFDARGLQFGDYMPLAIVIADETMAETLSWLKAFAPQTSPLSQFCRVLSFNEWTRFRIDWTQSYLANPNARLQTLRWSSLIVGELLSQTEGSTKLGNMPLAHASSCFSTTVAKAHLIHDSREVEIGCIERLHALEEMRGAARRSVPVQELQLMWMLLGDGRFPSNGDALDLIERAIAKAVHLAPLRGAEGRLAPLLGAESGLFSDSVEERVMAFQRVVTRLEEESLGNADRSSNFLAAAAAFLVGRGTSHLFLLQRAKDRWPGALAWFGTLAALVGPELWDGDWARAARGVEKQLRAGMEDWVTSSADLSWAEYLWLNQAYEGNTGLTDFPRIQARTLSVELVPGATCQFRFGAEPISQPPEAERVIMNQMNARIRELEGIVENFVVLASRSRVILEERSHHDKNLRVQRGQVTFHFDEDDVRRARTPKKTTRRTSE